MRILVWNINALIPTVKNFILTHGSIRGFFDTHDADIICFQETKLIDEKLTSDLACVDGYESYWAISQTKKGYSGVATYVRHDWSPVAAQIDSLGTLDTDLNGEGRVIVTDHSSFVLINVYVPNAGKRGDDMSERAHLKIRFLHALKAKCDDLREEGRKLYRLCVRCEQVVLVGDLNVAVTTKDAHPCFDWARMYHPEELEVMRALLRDYTDVWRLQHPDATDVFTVWDEKTSARSFNKGVRIDYVLVSSDLLPSMGECRVLDTPPKWSDHAALLVDIDSVSPPGPHPPPPESSRRMKRFDAKRQPSIAALFARKKAKPTAGVEASATAVEIDGRSAAGEGEAEPRPIKRLKSEAGVAGDQSGDRADQAADLGRTGFRSESAAILVEKSMIDQRDRVDDATASAMEKEAGDATLVKGTSVSEAPAKSKHEAAKLPRGQQGIASFFSRR